MKLKGKVVLVTGSRGNNDRCRWGNDELSPGWIYRFDCPDDEEKRKLTTV